MKILHAQYDPAKVSRKAFGFYRQSQEQAGNEQFREGIESLKQAIRTDSSFEDAYLSIAGMYGELKIYKDAVWYYARAMKIDSNYAADYYLPYSINLAGLGAFTDALNAVNLFLSIPTLNESSRRLATARQTTYQFAIDYQKKHAAGGYTFNPLNMGDSINTAVPEYFPSVSLDGKQLIFTRRVHDTNEDFYQSEFTNGHWTTAHSLAGNINTNNNEGALNISQDGQWLLFTGCLFPDGYGSCDLYISYLTGDGWSAPENLGQNINSEFWDSSPSLSPDKRDLYFTSNRPGGYGGSDLYVCHRLANGHWTAPENMGPGINSAAEENAPFIHADNQTLYFTSSGLPGYGGSDLFVVKKKTDGSWGIPENLGYPINTIENEGSMVVSADGKTAYYASDRADSRGQLDLYTFDLRNDVRPFKTTWVKGKVYDLKTKRGLPSAVELSDLATKQVLSEVQTDETGNYLITLPAGKNYAFNVHRKGYLFYSENFSLADSNSDSTYQIDIPLQPIEANASIILKNVFFDNNQFELKSTSQLELDEVVLFLQENPKTTILISGHTDNVGKAVDNLTLSDNRAKAVVNYLMSKGIPRTRLFSKGFGDTLPLDDNRTEKGRSGNRRTELKIVRAQ